MSDRLVEVQSKPRRIGKCVKILQEFLDSGKKLAKVEDGGYSQLYTAAKKHALPVRVQMINGETYLEKVEAGKE